MPETTKLFERISDEEKERLLSGGDILYLLLIEAEVVGNDCENYHNWEFITGRQEAYDMIKSMIVDSYDYGSHDLIVDIDKSYIYADNPHVEDSKLKLSSKFTFYNFMKQMKILGKVVDDSGFCIDDYHQEEIKDQD